MKELYNMFIEDSIKTIKSTDYNQIENLVNVLLDAYNNNKSIFLAGNGGSAATASHFHEDLCFGSLTGIKEPKRFKLNCLCDSTPYITAIGNDISYEDIFVHQLKNLSEPGSLFIGISCSGNSKNIVKCVEYALQKDMNVFCLLAYDGGAIGKLTKNYILVNADNFSNKERIHNFGLIEGIHGLILHYVVYEIHNRLKENKK